MSNGAGDGQPRLCDGPPLSQGIFFLAGETTMKTFEITIGPAATGQHKERKTRMFATRLSTGKRLEVVQDSPITETLTDIDAEALMMLEGQGFVTLVAVESKAKAPAKASLKS